MRSSVVITPNALIRVIRLGFFAILLIALMACNGGCTPLWDDPQCKALFAIETPVDSIPGDEITPPEAVSTIASYVTPQPTATPWPNVDCQNVSVELVMKPIEDVPSDHEAFFNVSPDERYIAINQYNEDRLVVLDQETGTQRVFDASGLVHFWIDDANLYIIWYESRSSKVWRYALNIHTGETEACEVRWEYNYLDLSRLTRDVYTGWQAAEALQVWDDVICKAVKDGVLQTVEASNGNELLRREDLLEHGTEILTSEYPMLISSEEIDQLRERVEHAVVLDSQSIGPVFEPGRDTRTWLKTLVLMGLPDKPHNLIVLVVSERHWKDYQLIPIQETIAGGYTLNDDIHPDFLVTKELCVSAPGMEYVLFAKDYESDTLIALGGIPYTEFKMYNQEGNRGEMVWSPDKNSIYADQWVDEQYGIYRLELPQPQD